MKRILFGWLVFFALAAPLLAIADEQADTIVTFESQEINNSKNVYGGYPTHGGDLPVTHYGGAGLHVPPDGMGYENAPGFYNFMQLLGIKSSYTREQMERIWGNRSFRSDKRSRRNNIMGFQVDRSPRARVRLIGKEVPVGLVFIPVGEYSKSDKEVFNTPQERMSWTGLNTLEDGGDVIRILTEGIGNGVYFNKFDLGVSGSYMTGARDALIGRLLNAFVSGGKGTTEQIEPPWLLVFGGKLYPAEELREVWEFWHNLFRRSGYDPEFLEIDIPGYAHRHGLEGQKFFGNDIDTILKREWVFEKLAEIENRGKIPKELGKDEKPEEAKKPQPAASAQPERQLKDGMDEKEVLKEAEFTGLFMLFDFNKSDIRPDQRDNGRKFFNFGREFAAKYVTAGKPKNTYILVGGHADHVGSADYNAILALNRSLTAAEPLADGMRSAKDETGKSLLTEKEIDDIIVTYSGSNINPLTNDPVANAENERAAVIWVDGIRLSHNK